MLVEGGAAVPEFVPNEVLVKLKSPLGGGGEGEAPAANVGALVEPSLPAGIRVKKVEQILLKKYVVDHIQLYY